MSAGLLRGLPDRYLPAVAGELGCSVADLDAERDRQRWLARQRREQLA